MIGVDLRYIRPIEGVETFVGDITHDSTMIELMDRFGGKADVVLSDMAPNIAGHYSMDHARSINLCMYAVDVCDRILKCTPPMRPGTPRRRSTSSVRATTASPTSR